MESTLARIWFFSDIHGSNACFKKFLNLINNTNKPNVLILGADITGKQLIPIIKKNNGTEVVPIGGKDIILKNSEESQSLKKKLSDIGYYPFECTNTDYKKLQFGKKYQKDVFEKLVKKRLIEWVELADSKLSSNTDCKVIINGGNDDPFYIDSILDSSKKMIHAEGKIIDLPAGLKLLSTGFSVKTPWNCPRDISEDELKIKISNMTNQLVESDKLIFNFHCPPYNTALDLAYKINQDTFEPVAGIGGPPLINVGSKVIRESIEKWQPIVSLHGHIHEIHAKQNIGKTLCVNPGTDYKNGRLQGFFIQINDNGIIEFETLTEERDTQNSEADNQSLLNSIISSIPCFGPIFNKYRSGKKQNELDQKIGSIQKDLEEIKNFVKEQKRNNTSN